MGKKCVLKNCTCTFDNSVGFTFHRFPIKDNDKYKQWVKSIPERLIELPLQQYTYVCSKHFPNDSYQPVTPTLKNVLRRNAAPSLFYLKSDEDATKENVVEDLLSDTDQEQDFLFEEEIDEPKKTFTDVYTQVSPKRLEVSEREERLQRDVNTLQKRLRRRDETMKRMHNILELLLENRQKFKRQCNNKPTSER